MVVFGSLSMKREREAAEWIIVLGFPVIVRRFVFENGIERYVVIGAVVNAQLRVLIVIPQWVVRFGGRLYCGLFLLVCGPSLFTRKVNKLSNKKKKKRNSIIPFGRSYMQ